MVVIAAGILFACSTTPIYLTDLADIAYTDTQMVIDQLDCTVVITEFHVGRGVSTESEAVQAGREVADRSMTPAIHRAEKVGDTIWVLATEAGQVIGAMSSEGGVSVCDQDVSEDPR
jgi:hypothetical protein